MASSHHFLHNPLLTVAAPWATKSQHCFFVHFLLSLVGWRPAVVGSIIRSWTPGPRYLFELPSGIPGEILHRRRARPMPRPVSYNGPAVRDPIKQSGSSPPGTETTLKEDMVQDIGTMRRRKSVVPRFRRLRVVRIYNIPANSRYISPRDDGDDKIRPSKGGKPAPSVAPASVAPPAQPLPPPPSLPLPPRPPSSRPATKQASTSSQTQAIATRTSSIVSSSATVQSYTTGADDAESSTSSSHSYSQQISVSSTSLVSDSTSTSDQYYEGGTSSSKLRALTTAISSSPTTLATSRSHMIPCSTMSITVVRPTNMVTLKPGALSPGRNAAIIGGTLGELYLPSWR